MPPSATPTRHTTTRTTRIRRVSMVPPLGCPMAYTSRVPKSTRRAAAVELCGQRADAAIDLVPHAPHLGERPAGGVVEVPVDVPFARQEGALVAAAHRDDEVGPANVRLVEAVRHPARQVGADLAH